MPIKITDKMRLDFVFRFMDRRDLWNALMDCFIAARTSMTYRQVLDAAIRAEKKAMAK